MTTGEVMKKSILPLAFMAFWFWMAGTAMDVSGSSNILIFLLFLGFPFGLHKMRLVLIPRGMDIGGTIGAAALCVMIGALIGCIMFLIYFAKAVLAAVRFVCRI